MPQELSRLARLFTTLAGFTVLAACGGGGGGGIDSDLGGGGPGIPPGGGGPRVTVSGRVTFDRLPFQTTLGDGLNPAPVQSPAREVVVQAIVSGTTSASTTTDADGNYSLSVPASSNMFIRVRAQMLKTDAAPTWTFTVRNNTQSDAVYTLDGATFNSGTANGTRDLHAPSGWTGNGYGSERAAAPFAILDTVYRTKELVLGAAPTADFPELNLYWSDTNRTVVDQNGNPVFCPDDGAIITSLYASGPGVDDCTNPGQQVPAGIYILGDYADGAGDTDEYDAHVIAHEFGHYFEDLFSRSDSIGGGHTLGDRLDLRVAFGEGWGNAFGAMALSDPVYRDSFDGIDQDGGFNLETDDPQADGWFSESSVGEILWDIFDTTPESGDNVTLGFGPIYEVMTGPQIETNALTSIFSFADALRDANGSSSSAIGNLLSNELITGDGEFGTGESNAGTDPGFTAVYTDISVGAPVPEICSTSSAGGKDGNKLGNRRFLRFVKNTSGTVSIVATGVGSATVAGAAPAQDPDIVVHLRGVTQSFGSGPDGFPVGQSGQPNQESMNVTLAAGEYVLEVYAFEVFDPDVNPALRPSTPRCMSLSISGSP